MADIIVVGVGNPYRGDDAAGWKVIDELAKEIGGIDSGIKLVKQRGDIAELIDVFASYKSVYLIDACQNSSFPGSWERIDLLKEVIKNENSQTSTHGFGLSQAISLARNLDQLPDKLILYAISGENYTISEGMSFSVAEGVKGVVADLLSESKDSKL